MLPVLVLKAFRDHFNQTRHSNHLLLTVGCFVQTPFTEQVT